MRKDLDASFFARPALEVAPDLLGRALVRRFNDREEILMISEVEAYEGPEDKASHARFGLTQRNEVMFGPPGHFYLYFIYGMYWMLNIVTEVEGTPSAVLIRGTREVTGPGRLTRYLVLDKSFNKQKSEPRSGLWIEEGEQIPVEMIKITPRIGVDYAQEWAKKHYRFVLGDH